MSGHCFFLFLSTTSTQAMLYLIGLGLGDETDITVKGLEAVKSYGIV
jgi:hypothetical protein